MYGIFSNVNFAALIIAGLAHIGVGYAWYSDKLFGNAWRSLNGTKGGKLSKDDCKIAWLSQVFVTFVITLMIANVYMENAMNFGMTMWYICMAWFLFSFEAFHGVIWEKKPISALLIEKLGLLARLFAAALAYSYVIALLTSTGVMV